jgi:hypothetical protein
MRRRAGPEWIGMEYYGFELRCSYRVQWDAALGADAVSALELLGHEPNLCCQSKRHFHLNGIILGPQPIMVIDQASRNQRRNVLMNILVVAVERP